MANVETILVVGGGVAGLTTATALHRHGFTTELVARQQPGPLWGQGFWCTPMACACSARSAGRRASKMQGLLFDDGASAMSTATSSRRPISKRCGATRVPASGLNGPKLQRALLP